MCFSKISEVSVRFRTCFFSPFPSQGGAMQCCSNLYAYYPVTRNSLLFVPGIGTEEKLLVNVARSASKWCCRARLLERCCTASTSNLSMACFMFSMCLLRMAFCSSYSVFCFLSCLSSASRSKSRKKREGLLTTYECTRQI